jgi:predicted unusual protein kinase regulating ubiquinone biosynthesis (AarF/ABC1/UbiB family)/CBS domain-containing protein
MQLSEAMRQDVVTISPDATLVDAARELRAHGIDAVIVAGDGSEPLGILTERDLVSSVVDGENPSTTTVGARMSTQLKTLPPTADADSAVDLMAKHGFRHVPVVEGGRVVGIFSIRDSARAFDEDRSRRPATDFGSVGVVSHFRGPYHDGPPAKDLEVEVPSITKFGVAELRRIIVVYLVLSLCIAKRMAGWVLHPRRETPFAAASHGAVDAFERLGPTFVKLGQLIASSPGIFPAPIANACLRCLDDVPPFPGSQAVDMVTADLGRSPGQIFKSFDENPLSAASIGQVHACVLPDGREAVIKLQRPNIRKRMTTDLRILHRVARTAEKHLSFAKNANGVAIVEDLHAVTFSELNPAVEAYRQDKFRNAIGAFGDNRQVTAPEVYWDFCGPHMICMERMSGVPMDNFDAIRDRGFDGELVLRRGAKTWLEAVAVHGPFHGDMHAGNIWVLDDGRASYLDFGIMGELDDDWKAVVKDLFFTIMIDHDFVRVARAYKRVGILNDEMGTDDELGMRLGMLMGPLLTQSIGDINIGELINMSVQLADQYGAQAPKELVLFGKQLLYIERYMKGLAPNYAMLQDPYLIKNIFPEEAAKKAAELGVDFPD